MALLALLTPPDTPESQCGPEDRAAAIATVQRSLNFPDTPDSPATRPYPLKDTNFTASPISILPPPEFDGSSTIAEQDMKLFVSGNSFSDLILESKVAEGQWGDVFKARLVGSKQHRRNDSGIGISESDQATIGQGVLAVKRASNKSALKVIQHEAKILTYLTTLRGHDEYIVPFYGYDMQHRAVVMQYVPRTLDDFVVELENVPDRGQVVEASMHRLFKLLVEGLHFMHDAGVIHGDIKPGNILLRGNKREFMQPLYCDFTASRFDKPDSHSGESAGTYDYMAPELFKATPESLPSFASDVYGLGVTLLYAIIGRSPFEDASNAYMRRAMAMQGTPLQFVSSSLKSLRRLQKSGLEPLVDGAMQKQPHKRWSSSDWTLKLNNERALTA